MLFSEPITFQWDKGNSDKNTHKHNVSNQECEKVFFDSQKKILKDTLHSKAEKRYILIGETKKDRLLFIIFTQRNNTVRIISARDLNKKEKPLYE